MLVIWEARKSRNCWRIIKREKQSFSSELYYEAMDCGKGKMEEIILGELCLTVFLQ